MICCSVLGLRYHPLINNHNARWGEIWDDGETGISRGGGGGRKVPVIHCNTARKTFSRLLVETDGCFLGVKE